MYSRQYIFKQIDTLVGMPVTGGWVSPCYGQSIDRGMVTWPEFNRRATENDMDRGRRIMRKCDQGWVGGKDKTAKIEV